MTNDSNTAKIRQLKPKVNTLTHFSTINIGIMKTILREKHEKERLPQGLGKTEHAIKNNSLNYEIFSP